MSPGAAVDVEPSAGAPRGAESARVAALTHGRVSQTQVSKILRQLTAAGLALAEEQPPSKLYTLNRDHLAAPGIEALAALRVELLRRLRELLAQWHEQPRAAWLFGSAARGDGNSRSDIDVVLVRPNSVDEDDVGWNEQTRQLVEQVKRWTGNPCDLVEMSQSELAGAAERDERLIAELRRDAIVLAGPSPQTLLRRDHHRADADAAVVR